MKLFMLGYPTQAIARLDQGTQFNSLAEYKTKLLPSSIPVLGMKVLFIFLFPNLSMMHKRLLIPFLVTLTKALPTVLRLPN